MAVAGFAWQELQVMYRGFQLFLINFDNVLVLHLTEPAPYMGQLLSPLGAHSVSGGTLLNTTGRHPESLWGIERTFYYSSLQIIHIIHHSYH